MTILTTNMIAGWLGMLAGILLGALLGLFFHQEEWAGGYGSFRRRLYRLGHIACFGLGMLNIFFALTAKTWLIAANDSVLLIASYAFLTALLSMPVVCLACAHRKHARWLFPLPVSATLLGVVLTISLLLKL